MQTPTFVVSIKRNQERCLATIARLERDGIRAQPWWGVDGTLPIQFKSGESVDSASRLYHFKRGRRIPPTTVGAYLSHYRLMKHALESGWKRILVFEDDIHPLPNLRQVVDHILALDHSFEHINLHPAYITNSITNGHKALWHPLPTGHQVVRNTSRTLGFTGYAATRSYLQRVVPQLMPIRDDVDAAAEAIMLKDKARAFSLWPAALAHQGPNAIYRGPYGTRHRAQRLITRWLLRKRLQQHKRRRYEMERELMEACRKEYGLPPARSNRK